MKGFINYDIIIRCGKAQAAASGRHIMSIKDQIEKINKKNRYFMPVMQGLLTIALVIAVSVVSIKLLSGDTLADYAAQNPDKAYAVHTEPIPEDEQLTGSASGGSGTVTQANTDESKNADANGSAGSTVANADTADPAAAGNDAAGADAADTVVSDATADATDEKADNGADTDKDVSGTAASDSLPSYNISPKIKFYNPTGGDAGRTEYEAGFYYENLNEDMKDYITGVSFPENGAPEITYDDLRYVGILYHDFNGLIQAGELICNSYIADDLTEIFCELYKAEYRLESVVLIDNFGGDDTASMCADNTSCFNYRVVDGSTSLSKHALGLAIDVNPYYNPYVVFGKGEGGSDYISPPGSEIYADRSASFAYKIDESDLCYRLFKEHGFTWGGNWNSCKDYQHFQKTK